MGTFIIGAIVLVVIGLASYSIYKDRKSGKTCGSCGGCGTSVCCGRTQPKEDFQN